MATSPYYQRFLELESAKHHDHDSKKNSKIMIHDTLEGKKPKRDWVPIFQTIHKCPEFKTAQSWGAYPQALYKACEQYGVDRVRNAILAVERIKNVRCRSRYLFAVLKNGGAA